MDDRSCDALGLPALEEEPSFVRDLAAVDWSFSNPYPVLEVESIHPYPAKFIGRIPRTLLDNLPIPKSTAVFDPFCGSGTTLVEAQRIGLPAIGIDLNPIACLLTRVKTSALPPALKDAAASAIEMAKCDDSRLVPAIPNVDHWFKAGVQQAISAIARAIAKPVYQQWSEHLRLALSSILVRVSNQDSDTRYAAVEKTISYEDVFSLFCTAAEKLYRALAARDWTPDSVQVIEKNTLEVKPADLVGPVGLVITSPPYPNAYEYWLYHKYRMWWLGFDPLSVKDKEIGARAHFFKKNHHTAELFIDQMRQTFFLIDGVLVKNGFVCFVVGRSRIHGKNVDNAEIIERVAGEQGLEPISRYERIINPHRKSFNLAHANIKTESVLIFKKV